ncbi:MAG: hypothetical protein GEU73_08475 [Chloroflexi bacterium]|nr:hypothetical protein [Chloroflexota bacterium]
MIQTALNVTGIDHLVLYTSDLVRARRFYTGLLGMEVAHENERQCFLHCGNGQQIALFDAKASGVEFRPNSEMNHVAMRLEAGQYEGVKARLEAEGIAVSGRTGDPHCMYFRDPDGHRLQLLTPAEWQGH